MKCPLLKVRRSWLGNQETITATDCLKADCAWWDKTRDQCIIKTAGNGIMGIMTDTMAIREKMPHEGQFRK